MTDLIILALLVTKVLLVVPQQSIHEWKPRLLICNLKKSFRLFEQFLSGHVGLFVFEIFFHGSRDDFVTPI